MAPSNGTTSTPPKLVVSLPSLNHSTLQWHPTMAPSNGTTSTAPCNGALVPRPIRQSGSSPSPLLEVRTPIAIAIWGKIRRISSAPRCFTHRIPVFLSIALRLARSDTSGICCTAVTPAVSKHLCKSTSEEDRAFLGSGVPEISKHWFCVKTNECTYILISLPELLVNNS